MPTPYVWRYPSKIRVVNVRAGASVRNVLVAVAFRPDGSTAVAETVYLVPVRSAHRLRHTRPDALMLPATGRPWTRACTPVIRPPAARTVIPASGATCVPPSPGAIVSRAVLATGAGADPVEWADELVAGWAAF